MLILLKNSLKDFQSTYKKYLVFEFIYLAITGFIFVPMLAYIFNRVLVAMGSHALLNMDVFKIVLNSRGLVGLSILSVLVVVIIFIEFGVLIIISQKRYFNEDILISEAFITTVKFIPKLFGLGVLHLIFYLLFIIPFLDLPLTFHLLRIDIPTVLMDQILDYTLFTGLYAAIFLAATYLFLRWIFSFHCIVIEGKSTTEAIRRSKELTKNIVLKILFKLLLFNVIIFAVVLVLTSFITIAPVLIGIDVESYYVENILITLSSFLTYIFALLLIPINIIFITRLYYQANANLGLKPDKSLLTHKSTILKSVEEKGFAFFGKRKYLVYLVLAIYLTGAFAINISVNEEIIYLGRKVAIAAHRGDSRNAPENSISSIRLALDQNVDFIEIDVRKTKDGVIILSHDTNLQRVAGVPYNVSDLTMDEIARLDIGLPFSVAFKGERIPTLNQVLEEVRGKAKLLVEIKPHTPSTEIAAVVVKIIQEHGMVDDVYIQSFDYKILEAVRRADSKIKIGQLIYIAAGNLSSLDVDFYSIEQSMLSKQLINNAYRDNREVWVWVVNTEKDIKETLRYDITGIITNHPERVHDIIGKI